MTRRLVLLRHGRTAWNAEERMQGQRDVPLDEEGVAQAEAAARSLARLGPRKLWCSDLGRARQTAAALERATGLVAAPDPRLREFDVGQRSGLTKPEFAERFPAEYAAWRAGDESLLVRGEESAAEVRKRVEPALRECWDQLGPEETGIAVLHGACLRVGLVALLDWPEDLRESLRGLDNCGWAVLTEHPRRRGPRLAAYNLTAPD